MRGLQFNDFIQAIHRRITPACAGTTGPCQRCSRRRQDHPRMCGDYRTHPFSAWPSPGSPPHVRGLPVEARIDSMARRITPACAGTTPASKSQSFPRQDHPRMCGDYSHVLEYLPYRAGSPPHVRGLPDLRRWRGQEWGITPACAGTTSGPGHGGSECQDHPRMCGDYWCMMRRTMPGIGSPPHVRGLRQANQRRQPAGRITPACAGTTICGTC